MSPPVEFDVLPTPGLPFGLTRFNNSYFLIVTRGLGMLAGSSRIFHKLNVTYVSSGPVTNLWLNSSFGNGEDGSDRFKPFSILANANPQVLRPTGRTRKEISAKTGAEINCPEFELVLDEEGLFRQCYYCLGWEGDRERLQKIEGDYFWCQEVCRLFPCRLASFNVDAVLLPRQTASLEPEDGVRTHRLDKK